MKRLILGVAATLLGLSIDVAHPQSTPVTVENTPLDVILKAIPEDMDQRRPVDVRVVDSAGIGIGQVRGGFINKPCAATLHDQNGTGRFDCDFEVTFEGPKTVRMVAFLPSSYMNPPRFDPAGFSCQATVFLSDNNFDTYFRVADTMWSAPNFAPSHVTLPVPVVIPPAPGPPGTVTTIWAKVRLWMAVDAPGNPGCRVRAILWATEP